MKVLYILPSFYCCGGNRIAIEHCNGLTKRGHDVSIVVTNSNTEQNWIKIENSIKVIKANEVRNNNGYEQYDIVVCTYFETFYDLIGWKDVFQKAKLYYFVQQLEDRFFNNDGGKKRAIRTYEMAKSNRVNIITEAKWIKDELKRLYGFDAIYVPNCQELPEIKNIELKTNKVKVLVEGNCETPNKGVQDAWEAVKDLDCFKILLTNTEERNVPSNYKFDKIFCNVPWETALSVIKSCDIIVKPSYFEGSPTPLMEAWELGTAVVTTNCTGWDEYGIEGINCLVCNIADIEVMKNKIQELINIKQKDEMEWYRFIENGKTIAKNKFISWNKAIDILEGEFNK